MDPYENLAFVYCANSYNSNPISYVTMYQTVPPIAVCLTHLYYLS